MSSFNPDPNDRITLFGEEFVVQMHPNAPDMAYAQEGGRATIFKLSDRNGRHHALKVFKPRYVDPAQSAVAERLARYCTLPGMRAAHRRVVREHDGHARASLDQAVAMPWIEGTTWFDILNRAKVRGDHLQVGAAVHLCRRFLEVLRSLEAHGVAHTDIAAGNVVIDLVSLDVQLVDLEDLFGPGFPPPVTLTGRTSGYARDTFSKTEFWSGAGDRFAGAVLAAEILALSAPELAPTCHGDSFFDPTTIGAPDSPQYRSVVDYLRGLVPDFAALFVRAWAASDLAGCATIAECASCIDAIAARTPSPDSDFLVAARHGADDEDREARLAATVRWVNLFDGEPIRVPPTPISPLPSPVPNVLGTGPRRRDRHRMTVSFYAVMVVILCAIMIAGIAAASH